MDLIPSETSLVVAGAWNAAILSPAWVQKYGFESKVDERVQIFVPAALGAILEFPRYVVGNLSYSIRPDALVVTPQDMAEGTLRLAEDFVARMLKALRHTPVNGVGHNFGFQDAAPQPEMLSVFTAANSDLGSGPIKVLA
jgi:hypothetical protein